MPRWPETVEGMETPTRARRRKPDTAKADLEPRVYSGGQGVHRKVESEGLEEKYRAAIDGGYSNDEPVGQRWGTVESALWRRRRTHSPHRTKVCAGGTVRKNVGRPQEGWRRLRVAPEEADL